jgi:hypothetical protein
VTVLSRVRWTVPAAAVAGAGLYVGVATGRFAIDLGVGRRRRQLGPIELGFDAPAEIVFDVIADPYLNATPRAMSSKLRVLERGDDLVLAEHYTDIGWGLRAVTVETVRFERPKRIDFRLTRGPVPSVVETFELAEAEDGGRSTLTYTGEMEADLWAIGSWWTEIVADRWVAAVEQSLASVKEEAERRHRHVQRSVSTSAPPE